MRIWTWERNRGNGAIEGIFRFIPIHLDRLPKLFKVSIKGGADVMNGLADPLTYILSYAYYVFSGIACLQF